MAIFKRKIYQKLEDWKENYANDYALLLEGARRVGKSVIAEEFAKKHYRSYILIDMQHLLPQMEDALNDINDLDLFFLRIQAITGVTLHKGKSVIIFDEIQLRKDIRAAIKYLVQDGRYHYIETGSLLRIKKNIEGIVLPSEEMKIEVNPLDFEEFLWATGYDSNILREAFEKEIDLGDGTHRSLLRRFRTYLAVGGMPQAVESYLNGDNFAKIDQVKKNILHLYEGDFYRIDSSGMAWRLFSSIPSQLGRKLKRYYISKALGKRKGDKANKLVEDLISSNTVNRAYEISDPNSSPSLSEDDVDYRLYIFDTGLFVTLALMEDGSADLYNKLLSDKLKDNLGSLYENAVAQMLVAAGHSPYYLYFHDGGKEYEVDFLYRPLGKNIPLEVKSDSVNSIKSLDAYIRKYQNVSKQGYVIGKKPFRKDGPVTMVPFYFAPFLFE